MTPIQRGDLVHVTHPYYTAPITLCHLHGDNAQMLDADTPVTCFRCLVRRDQINAERDAFMAGR